MILLPLTPLFITAIASASSSQVMVIDKGCIVEQGTHEQLIAMDGVYKKLVLRQMVVEADGN